MSKDKKYPDIQIQIGGMIHIIKEEDIYKHLNIMWKRFIRPELVIYFGRMLSLASDLITQTEAARLKKCSVKTIQYQIRKAKLPVYTAHRLVNRQEVEKLQLRKDAGRRRAPYNRKLKPLPDMEVRNGLPYFPRSFDSE